ncbi:ABC transporter substrate-binding protein [Halomonas urumqiensis]|uniref:ABC transporter substrate-binding protein n=1 Tax=Halomonas urumqiensis TaxID=1684789 RepID=A0A2N7UDS6_9GAMM|nr:ABC transporter substrate-binding protein [Halomonas urumqiensis]PMR78616.1 ABC transporter substrate-binding protein [Halomonas urumqiensis]PTB03760.1 ABC transporter substrate-binding protein [Halomonas urumqiensis]GHE20014.1 ABC transporter substrate-binding protein [Halomonas urumqiensis]
MIRLSTLKMALASLCLVMLVDHAAASDAVQVELQLQPPHLDPTQTASATTAEAMHLNVFQGLTRIDREGRVQPALARHWAVADDGRSIRFELRRGVLFHDGEVFDAHSAAFSLERLVNETSDNPQHHLFQAIQAVEVIDEDEIELILSRADALLPFRLGLSAAVMVHPASAGDNRQQPVGTGPYRFVGWRDDTLHLEVFDGYWGQRPPISEAVFHFTANRLELENGLNEGLIDIYPDGSSLGSYLQLAQRHDYVIEDGISEGEVILALNHAHAPFADRRVRRALAHAIDRQAMLDIYPGNKPPLIGSHFSPLHPAYVDLADRYPHDRERARALLEEAGVADSLALTLSLPPTIYAELGGLYVASDLEAVGIKVELERLTWGEWLSQVFTRHDYQMTLVSHVEPLDIDIYARDDYYFNYHSAEFRALWQAIESTADEAKRHRLMARAQRLLADEAVNVFLFMKPHQSIRKTGLKGAWGNSPIPALVLEELYWE